MGCIDASEMVDTYGAPPSEVRGFVKGGWDTFRITAGNLEGHSSVPEHMHPYIRISLEVSHCDAWVGRGFYLWNNEC